MSNQSGNLVFNGLGTYTLFTAASADNYWIDVKLQLSQLTNGGAASACVCAIKQGGVTKYTGTAGAQGAHVELICAAGDVITMVLSSAAAVDNALNTIQCVVAFSEGL